MDEIVDWATGVAGVPVSVGVLETETGLIAPLVRQGREPGLPGHFFLNMQRELSDLPPVPRLPPGFTMRPVEPGELPARAALHRAVWTPTLTDGTFAAMAGAGRTARNSTGSSWRPTANWCPTFSAGTTT